MQEPEIGSGELWWGVESAFRVPVRAGCKMLRKIRQLQHSCLGVWGHWEPGLAASAHPTPVGFLDEISSPRLGFAVKAEGVGRCASWSSAHLSHLSRFP